MSIRDRVARLVADLPQVPQFPTQGATLFVDLERRAVQRGYTPLAVVRSLLAGDVARRGRERRRGSQGREEPQAHTTSVRERRS